MGASFVLPVSWPYIGPRYGTSSPFHLRILILGESHYCDPPLTREFTKGVVQAAIDGDKSPSLRFFARTVGAFMGGPQDLESRRRFLETVAFYNFVQESAGTGPRIRPSLEMWKRATPLFVEVLDRLNPQFVLVLGKELWRHLSLPFSPGPVIKLSDDLTSETRSYRSASGLTTLFFPINHPSSPGWSYKKWCPCVKAALEQAGKFSKGQALKLMESDPSLYGVCRATEERVRQVSCLRDVSISVVLLPNFEGLGPPVTSKDPAAYNRHSDSILVNHRAFPSFPPKIAQFVLAHEIGHHRYIQIISSAPELKAVHPCLVADWLAVQWGFEQEMRIERQALGEEFCEGVSKKTNEKEFLEWIVRWNLQAEKQGTASASNIRPGLSLKQISQQLEIAKRKKKGEA